MNIFQASYPERLQSWVDLRTSTKNLSLLEKCELIDNWWQRAPLVNHYLHSQDTENWPDPWQLLSDNVYCVVARGIGICYTMHLVGLTDIELCEAVDEYGDEYIIVRCDKYITNYHPNTVLNNTLNQFKIKRTIDIKHLLNKIK